MLAILGVSSICRAQIDTTHIEGSLTQDRKDFVHSLKASLAIDDETTILRAHLLKLVVCRITSEAAKQSCKDLKESEELAGQNAELLDFALTGKNLRLVLEALAAIYRGATSYAVGKEAKDQIVSLQPVLALAIAQAGDSLKTIKTAANVLKEIQARPDAGKVFSENVALRVYEPFLHDVLDWLKGNEPDGHGDAWEIAGSKVIEESTYGCRVRKSGKFRCWKKLNGKHFDFPMETRDGFQLVILPDPSSRSMTVCSQGLKGDLYCWIGNPTSDGGLEIDKCEGTYGRPPGDSMFGSPLQWSEYTVLATLHCENSGDRLLGYIPRAGQYAIVAGVATNVKVDQDITFKGKKAGVDFFMNFGCSVGTKGVSCQKIPGLPDSGLNLNVVDHTTGVVQDAQTRDLFEGFGSALVDPWKWALTKIHNGLCAASDDYGFICRSFIIEGQNALALDHDSTSVSYIPEGSDQIAITSQNDPQIDLLVEVWGVKKKKTFNDSDGYQSVTKKIYFDGDFGGKRRVGYVDYFSEEKVLCYISNRLLANGNPDFDDPDAQSGASFRCVRLDDKLQTLGDVESAIPLTQSKFPIRIGRALCIETAGKMNCDFPAVTSRLFEHPALSLNASVTFYDKVTGFLCSTETDAGVCYDLNVPASANQIKSHKFTYEGFSKEFMLSRSMAIWPMGPGQDPLMCESYRRYRALKAGQRIYACESAGTNTKTYRITETYDFYPPSIQSAPESDESAPPPQPKKSPRKRSSSRSARVVPYQFFDYNGRPRTIDFEGGSRSPYFQFKPSASGSTSPYFQFKRSAE